MIMAYFVDKRGLSDLLFDGIKKNEFAFCAEENGKITGKALMMVKDDMGYITRAEAKDPDAEKMLIGAVMTYSDTNKLVRVKCECESLYISSLFMGFDKDTKEVEVEKFFTSGCQGCAGCNK